MKIKMDVMRATTLTHIVATLFKPVQRFSRLQP